MIVATDHLCWQCSYNLRGLSAAGRCPECGAGIDLARHPRDHAMVVAAEFVASAAFLLLIAVIILLDLAFAATLHVRFVAIVWLIAAIVAVPSWLITKKKRIVRLFAVMSLLLVALPFVPHTRVKAYAMFYTGIHPGMTRADVLARLDDYYPDRAQTGVPTIREDSTDKLMLTLGGDNSAYNAELIDIRFTEGRVRTKSYSPD